MRMANRTVEITSGDILIGDRSVKEGDPAQLRREIGYVIQQIGLFPHRTIAENIATVPKLDGWERDRISQRVETLLELIGLDPEFADRYPAQLSGGQQQRVGVARALAVDPPVMLMDEPFGAIDPINRARLQNEFLRLQAEIRKTVMFVTHDVDEAIKMGDRIAVMRKGGELAQFATPTELLMEPADDFVEDFVGADRALKRLALIRIADLALWTAPVARPGDASAGVLAGLASAEVPHAVLVDSENRPVGWLSEKDLAAETVPAVPDSAAIPTLEQVMTLRDGLATLLASGSQYGVVVDARGRLDGVLSVEIISDFLASDDAVEAGTTAVERAGV
jgi:osmoprotectant transport system ATP-binding protein